MTFRQDRQLSHLFIRKTAYIPVPSARSERRQVIFRPAQAGDVDIVCFDAHYLQYG